MFAHKITRRLFVGQAVAVPFVAEAQAAEVAPRVPVVDTHLHCFAGRNDKRFPYHERAPYRPEELATPEHLLRTMEGAGVDYAIVVHPEPYQDDHRYLEHCLRVGQGKLKGTALVFADRPGSVARLPNLVKRLAIVAVRIHAYAADRLPPFGRPELRALWSMATDLGIAVQLHFEPRYALGFEPYFREFSATKVLIDHMGRPFQGTSREYAAVLDLARYPNTIMKLSSLPSPKQHADRQVAAVLGHIVSAWGAERIMYGGGYGAQATAPSYRGERDRLRELLSGVSRADQDKILGGNAARLFNLGG